MDFGPDFFAEGRQKLYSSVLSDVLDSLGCPEHAMAAAIRPLDEALVLFGRARTGQYIDSFEVVEGENPYATEIALVDDLKPDDVAVLNCGGTERYAAWGELLTTAALARGAAGAVIDGQTRDVKPIRDTGFPVFARSIGMLDAKGRGYMQAFDLPVQCGGVLVRPGDLVFADIDGALVIPVEQAEAAVRLGLEKVAAEDTVRAELARGDRLADVFERHKIL